MGRVRGKLGFITFHILFEAVVLKRASFVFAVLERDVPPTIQECAKH